MSERISYSTRLGATAGYVVLRFDITWSGYLTLCRDGQLRFGRTVTMFPTLRRARKAVRDTITAASPADFGWADANAFQVVRVVALQPKAGKAGGA